MSKALATKNVAAVLLGVSMVLGFAFAFATPAKADAVSDLQAQIQALLAQIASLQGSTSSSTGGACVKFTFTANLKVGSKGAEVMQLQKFLNQSADTQVAATGAGSAGNETSTFGPATKAAVIKFQNKYAADILTPNGLTTGNGNWFASTRAKANAISASCNGNGGSTGGTTTGGNLIVAAASQPANSIAPQGAARVPFTSFTLTNTSNAPVTVNGVVVQRTGLMQDAVFSGVVLVDSNNVQLGTSKVLNSNHQATVGDTFTINPGQSMTLTVAGNMASSLGSYAGQVGGISVVGVNTTATVGGSLPINGAMQTINGSLSIGSISTSTSAFDPGSAQTKNIGDTAVRFSGIRFTAGSTEDVKLYSIRWRQVGTGSSADLSNVVTVANGTSYPTTLDASGRYYTTTFPGGILIAKGNSIDVYVQGDITGSTATSRNFDFDIDKSTDVYFVGQLYGFGVTDLGCGGAQCTNSPWYNGNVTTVTGASVTTIARDTSSANASQNVAINVANQPLGGYVVDLKGEAVTVQRSVFTVATSSASTGLLQTVSIVDENGRVVAGPIDATWVGGVQTLTFTDSVTYPTGRHVYSLRGKVPSGANDGATIAVSSTPSTGWTNITGQTTGNSVSLSAGTFTMNTMTVKAGALAVSLAATPVAQSIIAGAQSVTFSNVQLDASQSGEDVRLNGITLTEDGTGDPSKLTSCQLWDGSNALNGGSNTVNPASVSTSTTPNSSIAYTFDNSLVIPKGTVKTLAVKCNVSANSDSSSSFQWGVSAAPTVTGVTSGSSLSASVSANSGPLMTIASAGSLTATAASTATAQPALSIVPAGTTGVTMGNVKLHATNEDVQVTKLGLTLTNGTANNTGNGTAATKAGDVVTAYIYNGATLVGTVTFTGTTATSTLSTPVTVAANSDVILTVKADVAQIGYNQPGGIGDTVKVDPLNAQAIGVASGSQINISATSGVNGVQMFKSVPTVASAAGTCSNCSGTGQVLKAFTVTANAAGSISVEQLVFNISTSTGGATVTNALVQVLDQNGNVATSTFSTQMATVNQGDNTFTGGPVIIPAGATYTFKLLGDVTPGSNQSWNVNVTLKGDGSQSSSAATASSANSNKFVWSDNATTTASLTDVDWFGGFQVNGLPSSGL